MAAAKEDIKTKQTVVITGASRGIGLGLAGEFAKLGYRVIATARTVESAKELNELAKSNANLHVAALVVSDEKIIASFVASLSKAPFSLSSLDILINNAGIAGSGYPRETLATVTTKDYLDTYTTNVVGPSLLTQQLLPLLKKSPHARVINVSTIMGSIALANEGLFFPASEPAYRTSKAGLNMLSAIQAQEFNSGVAKVDAKATAESTLAAATTGRVTVVAVHPGWVATEMGSKAGSPPMTVAQSVAAVTKVVTTLTPSNTTRFLSYDGSTLAF